MKEITFLNTRNKAKHSCLAPFTSKIADLHENIREKGAEKQAVGLRNTNIIEFGTVMETWPLEVWCFKK